MLDQPTQAFYPPDVSDVATEDLRRRSRIRRGNFALMRDLVEQLSPKMQ
jgi:hypothetical protein